MPSAKFTQTYEKVSKMGEKLKAAGKQGPSNDEQLNVRLPRLSYTFQQELAERLRLLELIWKRLVGKLATITIASYFTLCILIPCYAVNFAE